MTLYDEMKAARQGLQARPDMAQLSEIEYAARGAVRLAAGGAFLVGLSFGCGLALGFVIWGLSA